MPDTRFGFATHFAQGWSTSLMPLIAATGCAYIRDDLSTGGWEPTPGTYAIPTSDKTWIDSAHANGLLVLGIISKNNSYASGDPYDATFMANRAKFIAQSGLVDVIEVVNEPNNDFQTVEGSANWESKLAALTTAVTNAVNSVSSTVQVIGLGAQGNQIISILGSTTVDGIVYHPYDNDNGTVGTFIPETVFEGSFTNYEGWLGNIMAATPLPLWETEWGTQTVTGFSEDNQACFLVRRLLIAMALAVDHTFIYEFKDNNSTDLYGVYNQAGTTAKASYAVVTRFISAMQGVVGTRSAAVPASSGFANRSFGVTINSVANGNTAQAYAYLLTGPLKTIVATWLGNTSPTNPPASTTTSITFTVNSPYSIAGSSVLNPIAGTSVPLSTFTTSVSGTSLTVSGLPISDHPSLIILMAGNHYVRPTQQLANTGADWNNAWSATSINWANVVAGDTVWFAAGSYASFFTIPDGKSGTSAAPIRLQSVLASDTVPAASPGFLSSFVGSCVTSAGMDLPATLSWIIFDGRTDSPYGFIFNKGTSGGSCLSQTGTAVAIDHLTLRYLSLFGNFKGTGLTTNDNGINLAPQSGSISNLLITHCSIQGCCESIRTNLWNGAIIEYCYLADNKTDNVDHADLCYNFSPSNNICWRYNLISNSPIDGLFWEFGGATASAAGANGFVFTGNVYFNSQNQLMFFKGDDNATTAVKFYGPVTITNNVFHTSDSSFSSGASGALEFGDSVDMSGSVIINNIFHNTGNSLTGAVTTGQGIRNPPVASFNASNQGTPSEASSFAYSGVPFALVPADVAHPDVGSNQSNGQNAQFELLSSQYATFRKGTPVTERTGFDGLPLGLATDRDGNARGNGGAWMVGAYDSTGAAAPAPSLPTGLAVGTITSTTITLSWTTSTDAPNSNASLTYNLERKTGAGAFSTIKTGIAGVTSGTITYTDGSLTASTLYTYNVQAQNTGGLTSAFTTTNASGTTTAAAPAPSIPTGLTAVALTSSSISLSWTTSTDAPDTNASLTYKLQRKLGAGAFATLPAVVPGVASGTVSFTDTGLAPSSLYTYNVQCVNQEGLSSAFTTTNASATTSAGPAVAFVQITDSGAPTGTATTKTATYALAQGATHTNIVVVNIGNASSATLGLTISSVADTVNGAYTAAPPGLVAMSIGTLSQGSQVFYRSNIAAAAAGGNTVTVTASAAASFFEIAVLEYSGLATTSPVDVSVSAAVNGSGATVNATSGNSVPTLNSNDLLLGAFSFFDAPSAAGTGYTARNTPPPYTLYVEDQLVTATGSYASTATAVAGGSGWTAQLIAFKAAPAGAPTTLTDSVALIPGTKLAPVSRDTHRGKPSLLPGSVISVLSRDSHRESVVVFPGSLLTLIPSTGGTITLPDVASISAGTALSFNARRTYRALAGFNPGITPLLNPTLNGIIAPQVVQVNSATPSSVSTINCTYVQAQNRGDLNVVIVGWTNASSLTVNSVTDTVNGAYTLGVPLTTIGTVQQAMYFLPNILSASAGTNIVTVVLSGVATQPDVRILEYSGIVTSLPIDATGSNTGSNASPSVSVVSLNSNDLVVAGGTSISNFLSAGPLFTTRLLTADHNIADDAVFVWGQWVNSSGQAAIHWEDAAWHWEDAHFWEQGSSTGGTAGDWINTGSTQGKWFG